MLRVFADHHDSAFALNDLTFFANFLYGWLYFHFVPFLSYLARQVIRPFVRS